MIKNIFVASPRGFCAGVDRAILIVEKALEKNNKVYVKHEIVHNKKVVNRLKKKGAIFIEDLKKVPNGSVLIFSAHGVSLAIKKQTEARNLSIIDATCPLVEKVHKSVRRSDVKGKQVVLIGHDGHVEVEGTMGQLDHGKVHLVSDEADIDKLNLSTDREIAYTTQTTLSMEETSGIIKQLKKKYPKIQGPSAGDLCYATTNRQNAVKQIVKQSDMLLVIGSKNSSNSSRLKEIGTVNNIPSYLIDGIEDIKEEWLIDYHNIGISSGASAPEDIVQDVISFIVDKYPNSKVQEIMTTKEDVHFSLPKSLKD